MHIAIHTLRPAHTIYHNIYTFYIQIFFGLCVCLFFCGILCVFILITSLQERVQAAPGPTGCHATAIYTALYTWVMVMI